MWKFQSVNATDQGMSDDPSGPTSVSYHLTYEFANPLYGATSAAFFGQVAETMIKAFEDRCLVIYGKWSCNVVEHPQCKWSLKSLWSQDFSHFENFGHAKNRFFCPQLEAEVGLNFAHLMVVNQQIRNIFLRYRKYLCSGMLYNSPSIVWMRHTQ